MNDRNEYVEIEDLREIRRLNRELSSQLRKNFRYPEARLIGSPSGTFPATVRFLAKTGESVFWWTPKVHKAKKLQKNLFGHGTPHDKRLLYMNLQFNVPVAEFSRQSGGAFLRDQVTGNVVLAHRGIVTIGNGRFLKSLLFTELDATVREASTSSGPREFLIIDELKSPALVNRINAFTLQVRNVRQYVNETDLNQNGPESRARGFAKLRDYFQEFSGQPEVRGRQKSVADYYHGQVVTALRNALDKSLKVYKSREIDLVVGVKSKKPFLFEIKTSTNTQAIYTAAGQLMIHAPRVAQSLSSGRRPQSHCLAGETIKTTV